MHEIRASVPPEYVLEAVRLAHKAGITRVTVADVFVHGPDAHRKVVSVETSTHKARAFVGGFLDSPILSRVDYTLTSREVRAIVDDEPLSSLTRPMSEPFTDIVQDLWQLGHITPSYIARATAGAILLATGIIQDNPVAIVVAALFLPFLAQVLAVSFGLWARDRQLIRHGLRALFVSTALALVAGAVVGWIEGGPILFTGFKNPLSSLAISAWLYRRPSASQRACPLPTIPAADTSSALRRRFSSLSFPSGWVPLLSSERLRMMCSTRAC